MDLDKFFEEHIANHTFQQWALANEVMDRFDSLWELNSSHGNSLADYDVYRDAVLVMVSDDMKLPQSVVDDAYCLAEDWWHYSENYKYEYGVRPKGFVPTKEETDENIFGGLRCSEYAEAYENLSKGKSAPLWREDFPRFAVEQAKTGALRSLVPEKLVKITQEELDELLIESKKFFESGFMDGSLIDLSHKDLSGLDFSSSCLRYVDLSGSNLVGANFEDADLSHTNLSYADFRGANMSGAQLFGVVADSTNFMGVDLSNTGLSGDFISVNMAGAKFDGNTIYNVVLDGANLSNSTWKETRVEACDLSGSDLRNTIFSDAIVQDVAMKNVRVSGAYFDGAKLNGCELSGVSFCGTNLAGTSFDDCDVADSSLLGAHLDKTVFTNMSMGGLQWPRGKNDEGFADNVKLVDSYFGNDEDYKKPIESVVYSPSVINMGLEQ